MIIVQAYRSVVLIFAYNPLLLQLDTQVEDFAGNGLVELGPIDSDLHSLTLTLDQDRLIPWIQEEDRVSQTVEVRFCTSAMRNTTTGGHCGCVGDLTVTSRTSPCSKHNNTMYY